MDDNLERFRAMLDGLVRKSGLTNAQAGKLFGCTNSYVSLLRRGRREPSLDTLVSVARTFGVSLDTMFGLRPSRRKRAS